MTERTTEALHKAMAAVAGTAPEAPDLPLVPSHTPRRWTPSMIASAAFVFTLVVGGVGLLVLRGGSTPVQVVVGGGETWVRVPDTESLGETDAVTVFGGPGNQQMLGLVVLGDDLIAVGSDSWGGDEDAAVWVSPDGRTWTRIPHDETVFGGPGDQRIVGVAAGDQGAVAVGVDDSGGGDAAAAVWTSPDGRTWTRVPHDEVIFGGAEYQGMWAVAAGGPGFVAAGIDSSGRDADAAVWTSPDGRTWTRIPHDVAVFGGPGDQQVFGITAGDLGVIAVGSDGIDGYDDAAVWTSTDGLTWVRVPNAGGVFGGPGHETMSGVAVSDLGVVAVGSSWFGAEPFHAAVWTSRDGVTWTRVPDGAALIGNDAKSVFMRAVTVGGTGVVAVGMESSLNTESDPAVWTSPDGAGWTRVADPAGNLTRPGAQQMLAAVVGPVGLVAVGRDGIVGYTDVEAAVWEKLNTTSPTGSEALPGDSDAEEASDMPVPTLAPATP